MNILYIGDIMGETGVKVVAQVLPGLKKDKNIDFVIAQAENVTDGKGISRSDYQRLRKLGVDAFTGGNWSLYNDDIHSIMTNPAEPIVRPANYPASTPGKGFAYVESSKGKVLVVSLLGSIVGRDAEAPVNNPLKIIDAILATAEPTDAIFVNFHGDYSSEKVVIGHYLDGRVSAVVGDHWHVPTADAKILPKGTAHMTDVGMCGSLDSSLGIKFEIVIERWRDGKTNRNELETEGAKQFNGVLIETDGRNKALNIEPITKILN